MVFLQLTSRIRRRRAQDVADTTDSLRAVACIRFVEQSRAAALLMESVLSRLGVDVSHGRHGVSCTTFTVYEQVQFQIQ